MKHSISQLDQAYEICRKETQQWAKTFYLGTLLLPIEKRKAIWAIYVWCRRTDEIMDSLEASTKSQDELAENLNEWEENTKNVFKGNIKSELDAVLLDTIEKYPQSIQPYLDMIDGQRMDLNKFRYKDFDELKLYCYRVAGTVGLMMAKILKVNKKSSLKSAIDLGIAMQLTTISRDVIEDSKINRFYINKNFEEIYLDLEKLNLCKTMNSDNLEDISNEINRQIEEDFHHVKEIENFFNNNKNSFILSVACT